MTDRTAVQHWTRPLRDGDTEFFMRANGQTMSGSADEFSYRELRALFEKATGVILPEPEVKRPRG